VNEAMAKEKLDKEAQEKAQLEKDRAKWRKEEAKRRTKKSAGVNPVHSQKLKKALSILVVAVVVLGLAAGVGLHAGLPQVLLPAAKVGNSSVSAPEWAYYFYNAYAEEYSYAQQVASYYAQLGMEYPGLDLEKSPFEQTWTDENTGATKPYQDYLRQQTNDNVTELLTLYQEAKKNGVALSDENKQAIKDRIAEIRTSAGQSGMGASTYLSMTYTTGITVGKYRSILERAYLAQAFVEKKQEEIRGTYPDSKLLEEYNEDPTAYQTVSLRIIKNFSIAALTAKDGESAEDLAARQAENDADVKKNAEKFLAAVTDEDSFVALANAENDAAVTPDYNADTDTALYRTNKKTLLAYTKGKATPLADWAYAADRAAGNKAIIETDDHYYVVYLVETPYQMATVDYYSTALNYPTPAEGEELTDEQKTATKAEADALVKQWQEAGGAVSDFAALLKERAGEPESDVVEGETVTTEVPTGYTEQATPGTGSEAALNNWLFNSGRKERDHAVLATAAGYTLVVFEKQHTKEDGSPDYIWMSELANTHLETDYQAYLKDAIAQYAFSEKAAGIKYGLKSAREMCDTYILNMQAQSQLSSLGY
jgi:hypothetical protein